VLCQPGRLVEADKHKTDDSDKMFLFHVLRNVALKIFLFDVKQLIKLFGSLPVIMIDNVFSQIIDHILEVD
jgi:hypothetical protein